MLIMTEYIAIKTVNPYNGTKMTIWSEKSNIPAKKPDRKAKTIYAIPSPMMAETITLIVIHLISCSLICGNFKRITLH